MLLYVLLLNQTFSKQHTYIDLNMMPIVNMNYGILTRNSARADKKVPYTTCNYISQVISFQRQLK